MSDAELDIVERAAEMMEASRAEFVRSAALSRARLVLERAKQGKPPSTSGVAEYLDDPVIREKFAEIGVLIESRRAGRG